MNFIITCNCGYSGKLDDMIHVSDTRRIHKSINGEQITNIVYDRIYHCPNCGYTETKTCSLGAGGRAINEDEDEEY